MGGSIVLIMAIFIIHKPIFADFNAVFALLHRLFRIIAQAWFVLINLVSLLSRFLKDNCCQNTRDDTIRRPSKIH